MINKKAQVNMAVWLIAGAIGFIVLLVAFYEPVADILQEQASSRECNLFQKPYYCPSSKIEVTKKLLDQKIQAFNPKEVLEEFASAPSGTPQRSVYLFYNPNKTSSLYRWALSKIVADAMNDCRMKVLADIDPLAHKGLFSKYGELGEDPKCVICSRIVLNQEARTLVRDPSYDNPYYNFMFSDWLKAHKPFAGSKKSYYDILRDSADFSSLSDENEMLMLEAFIDNMAFEEAVGLQSEAIAVVFGYLPVTRFGEANVRFIKPYPYSKVSSEGFFPFEDTVCEGENIID